MNEAKKEIVKVRTTIVTAGILVLIADILMAILNDRGIIPLYVLIVVDVAIFAVGMVYILAVMKHKDDIDGLTGIWNTKRIMKQGGLLERQGRLRDYAVIFLNLKDSKLMNQRFGNRIGDWIFREYAQRLYRFIRSKGYVGRLGGDNFVLILKKQFLEETHSYLRNVRLDVKTEQGMVSHMVFARAGIYLVEGKTPYQAAFSYASFALDEAKRQNEEYIYFEFELRENYIRVHRLLEEFKLGLERGEFEPFYQPKVDLRTNQVCGCEALTRWKKGDGETLLPDEFIPVLVDAGRITELDFYIFKCVCKDLRRWLDMGLEPERVSVNFSQMHLANTGFADRIFDTLDHYHIEGRYIEIELTESSAIDDPEALKAFIAVMRANDVQVAMDDFGTISSSLSMLREVDVDVIKLDKVFLNSTLGGNEQSRRFIEDILRLITHQGHKIVCEGVESQEQADMLREFGCDVVQGNLFDHAMPAREYERRLFNNQYEL